MFARLELSGAIYDVTEQPVTQATVKFRPPGAATIGKITGDGPHRLSINLPIEDLPGFAATVQGPQPLMLYVIVNGSDDSVGDFKLESDGF